MPMELNIGGHVVTVDLAPVLRVFGEQLAQVPVVQQGLNAARQQLSESPSPVSAALSRDYS
jgi:hypothetical protein